jgi:hypothetical protein
MKLEVENKLSIIEDIWNEFIWEYKFCSNQIKFTEDVQSNYFGDILGYFQDTFDVIFKEKSTETFSDRFAYNISLLQAIYIQQDFIEELLLIFKCGISKGDLKKNENYSINRDIRNELIGHPIRKINIPIDKKEPIKCKVCGNLIGKPKHKSVLLSSTLFANDSDKSSIRYLRYHKDNNYKFESKSFKLSEIINRHRIFLNTYFDKIIIKLKSILVQYNKKIIMLEKVIDKVDFSRVLNLAEIYFESILKCNYIYDKESLMIIYNRRKEHVRYQNLIDNFLNDFKIDLVEIRQIIAEILEPRTNKHMLISEKKTVNIVFTNSAESSSINLEEQEVSYNYELSKLANKRNPEDFEFFSGILKAKCTDNALILNELNHMESNIYNEIEYYTAYRLICLELKTNS